MSDFTELKCEACRAGAPAATSEERARFLQEHPEWTVIDLDGVPQLRRTFNFANFVAALDFTNKVGALAEAEDHHPALLTEWGKSTVTWWTHKIKDLHLNDLIAASKTDAIYAGSSDW
ncbi:MAG: 4a-hydroxytetrahydrobiopterin dehydratase [Verrucomicrobia bacterium]|nr:4a-hydroxytetrahydrobiopterin dehydratase [Verrucomicrobiota bacterium]MDA1086955.1 4a-hydroxytetrahydrobiopterin dehydratase [Verrucomicrobiota bacterium]